MPGRRPHGFLFLFLLKKTSGTLRPFRGTAEAHFAPHSVRGLV